MSLPDAHLQYPLMRQGMDHDRYAWSMLTQRPRLKWPQNKPLAVWVNVCLQHFPLNPQGKPVKLPGSMSMPYPDLRHFSLRDYGNRVGIYRFLQAFDRFNIQPSFAINAALIERNPYLMDLLAERQPDVIAHSWSMDTPHAGGLDIETERTTVSQSLDALRHRFGPIDGWLSPGRLQSANTPELIKAEGLRYHCDWVNDELPYAFHTAHGDLWALPLSTELEDRFVVQDNLHSESSWAQQVLDAFDFLLAESRSSGHARLLSLNLHPWVMGQPHRMKHLETVLERISAHAEVWHATPKTLLSAMP